MCFGGTTETADTGEAAVAIPTAMFVGDAALVAEACTWGTRILLQSQLPLLKLTDSTQLSQWPKCAT